MSSSNGFTFELDPSSLPQLSSKGDNYTVWRAAWTIAFRCVELWDIVSDGKAPTVTEATPATPALLADIAQWKRSDNQALVMIMSAVHPDNVWLVTTATSACQAWTVLQDRFDRDTATSTVQQFCQLITMEYDINDNLIRHLDAFHQAWVRLERRCRSSDHELAKSLRPLFSSDSIKGSFFLTTLPKLMDNVVDDLSTQNLNKFVDIEPRMLDIAYRRQQPTDDNTYYTKTAGKATRTRPPPPASNECTWCRKHNLSFVGHVYTDCHKLADYKKKKDNLRIR
ncbi:hypothetical protein J3F83DRAFT_186922 [Trichoderma novae-zelandiae]